MTHNLCSATITTWTGKPFLVTDPPPGSINILDIAHSLSNICRFTGHCSTFYSVAQHSIRVARNLPPELMMAGLLHDASEAYLADVSTPVKQLPAMKPYRALEKKMQKAIGTKFGVSPKLFLDSRLKHVDRSLFLLEMSSLMDDSVYRNSHPEYLVQLERARREFPDEVDEPAWTPTMAEQSFVDAFERFS